MMSMRISEAAAVLQAPWQGQDVDFCGVGIDSRSLETDMLFVALPGEKVDGHRFLAAAQQAGAAGALVEQDVEHCLPSIRVADSRRGLARLAAHWRGAFQLPVLAVTGSNGKTTVKEMLAAILRRSGPVLATRGNYNNDLGLPLTLARLAAGHRHAVLEMGASAAGEIANLATIAQPDVGVVTQCAPAHLDGFGSIEGVARAKGELFSGLSARGTAVVNVDDHFAPLWLQLAGERRVIRFGLDGAADVSADWRPSDWGSQLVLRTPLGGAALNLPLPGRHNVMNALAATAAALAVDQSLEEIVAGLQGMTAVQGRLQLRRGLRGVRVLDDTYNANPTSLSAGLEVLTGSAGETWLVLGDMAELGPQAADLHYAAGEQARKLGVDRLFAFGELSQAAAQAFGRGAMHFEEQDRLVASLKQSLHADLSILVKGSRSMGMEKIVQSLQEES